MAQTRPNSPRRLQEPSHFVSQGVGRALCSVVALIGMLAPNAVLSRQDTPPNVLIILADDLGWKDVGYHGSEFSTPSIDRIAREGIELDRFYVQPTCSPTRAGLMTGKSPVRLGLTRPISKNEETGLPLTEKLLPAYLGEAGYQSLMVGKWHLGHVDPRFFPQSRGFEHFYGHVTGGIGYWDHNHGGGLDWQRNGSTIREEGYSTRLIADEAIRVLEARDRNRPTFLYVAFNAPHLPNEAPDVSIEMASEIENQNRRTHAAMMIELDHAIGRILDAFEHEGLAKNTLVIFSSDNGGLNEASSPPPLVGLSDFLVGLFGRPIPVESLEFLVTNIKDGGSDNTPLPGGKTSTQEGGVRVPAAIWWPGELEGGRHLGFMTISDVLPTILEAVGESHQIPDDLDGRSQWSTLRDPGTSTGGVADYVTVGTGGSSLYRAPWKLVRPEPLLPWGDSTPRLYQIYQDPFETNDVAVDHPELVLELMAAAAAWPVGPSIHGGFLDILRDPDRFGGPEDRTPWAEAAIERAKATAAP
jgi:arylsulfatase A-like enzyme